MLEVTHGLYDGHHATINTTVLNMICSESECSSEQNTPAAKGNYGTYSAIRPIKSIYRTLGSLWSLCQRNFDKRDDALCKSTIA